MFDWFRRKFSACDDPNAWIDGLNIAAGGGPPVITTQVLGHLLLRSGTLRLRDPSGEGVEVPNIAADRVEISATLRRYPSGSEQINAVRLCLGAPSTGSVRRKVGSLLIDAAKVIVVDEADFHEHATMTGKDRIGEISTARDDTVLRLLMRRFKLKTVRVNRITAQVAHPVSVELAEEITAFLKTIPEYAAFPFLYFRVRTNDTYERAISMSKAWEFMPIGNEPEPLMFVCETGRGDGCYEVIGEFAGDTPIALSVDFIEE